MQTRLPEDLLFLRIIYEQLILLHAFLYLVPERFVVIGHYNIDNSTLD